MRILSPSAVSKYRQCKRLYPFEYNEGLKPPSSPKQEFGTRVHAQLEQWYRGHRQPDESEAGLVARLAIAKGMLPERDPRLLVEHSFELFVEAGLTLTGLVDLGVPPTVTGGIPHVIDHKTTSGLRWAKSEEQLRADPQVLVYAAWAMVQWQSPVVRCQWNYYVATNPKEGPRKAQNGRVVAFAVDCRLPAYLEPLRGLVSDLRAMAAIREEGKPGLAYPPNHLACGMYGGCPHIERCNLGGGDILAAYLSRNEGIK